MEGDVYLARKDFQDTVKKLCSEDLEPHVFHDKVMEANTAMWNEIYDHQRGFDAMFRDSK